MKKGIDISKHQGDVDFVRLSGSDIEFIIPRIGYWTERDGKFERNIQKAREHGIEIPGVYLYSYAKTKQEAFNEAEFACSECERLGLPKDTIIFYDLEYTYIEWDKKKNINFTRQLCCDLTTAFCEHVITHGYKAGVYFNMHYYRSYYTEELLSRYEKWLADWSGDPDLETRFHQYSSEGKVPGIYGNVDMNYIYGEPSSKAVTVDVLMEVAGQVIRGNYGNGEERKNKIIDQGYNYGKVQYYVNDIYKTAKQVVDGQWGNGQERKERLKDAGYVYEDVQFRVNQLVEKSK